MFLRCSKASPNISITVFVKTELTTWQRVTGHAQVTDTNLLLIEHRHGRKFVTFDSGIKNWLNDDEKTWIEVIPE